MNVQKMVLVPFEKYEKLLKNHNQSSAINTVSIPPVQHAATTQVVGDQESKIDSELILAGIPKQYKNKAQALLQYLQSSTALSWNDQGEIIKNGTLVKHSHIADLIKYAMRDYGQAQPVGLNEFRQTLTQLNIPKNLIGNPKIFDSSISVKPPGILARSTSGLRPPSWITL